MGLELGVLIVEFIGILIALVMLIVMLRNQNINLKKANQIQQDSLMHDMVKEEIKNWKYIHDQKVKCDKLRESIPKSVKAHIFNYYEYLAYLINHKKINRKQSFKVWEHNIFGMYEDFKEEFLENRTELGKLYARWKRIKQATA